MIQNYVGRWTTHKIDVGVVNWCFLFAIVDDDKNGVDEITGEADVGQRNPQAEGQEPVN